ncbi:sulfotransferase [Psychroflexus sp. CAK8W]|uniref:Sulfotransferase n=1 Tax=Psychroflexus longus TaxID=2873596 RepID=A0ABS7XKB6_9FLAO|nr:sulfotransferase [Psychroflexus longus]MBZ9779427.1 sulfotransferase [Psychroflexus longus]
MNIIIHGPGRSGTTLFNKMFSYHPDFVWLSSWHNRFPNQAWLGVLNTIYQNQWFGKDWSSARHIPKPAEAYGFWTHYFQHFITDANLEPEKVEDCKKFIKSLKQISGKQNFVTKLTGNSRKTILDEVFDRDYLVLWIERDPRVVISSYMKQRWFYKNKPKEFAKLSMEEKIKFYAAFYKKHFDGAQLLDRKILKYEDLCKEPLVFFENLFNDLGLKFYDSHRTIIKDWDLKTVSWDDYSKKYTLKEIELFNSTLKEELNALNYTI